MSFSSKDWVLLRILSVDCELERVMTQSMADSFRELRSHILKGGDSPFIAGFFFDKPNIGELE